MNLQQHAVSTEHLQTMEGLTLLLTKFHFTWAAWPLPHSLDSYNGKTILNYDGEPVFAELYILKLLEREGFQGVWVDTYRNKFWDQLPSLSQPVSLHSKLKDAYEKIYKLKVGRKSGCFDVMAYKDDQYIFVELKRKKKDSIRESQIEWLEAGLKAGFNVSCFIIAEWDLQ